MNDSTLAVTAVNTLHVLIQFEQLDRHHTSRKRHKQNHLSSQVDTTGEHKTDNLLSSTSAKRYVEAMFACRGVLVMQSERVRERDQLSAAWNRYTLQ